MNLQSDRKQSPRILQKRRQARQELLATAREILREQGIEGVTLAAVAGRLGLTRQAIYHYFPSKDALLDSLVAALLDDEIRALSTAVGAQGDPDRVLGTLVRAFHAHYAQRLHAFRAVYCQTQLGAQSAFRLDDSTISEEIHPRTRHLFDLLETRLGGSGASSAQRARIRRLAFTAWTSALGLLTMLSIADATGDRLAHEDRDLVETLASVYDRAMAG